MPENPIVKKYKVVDWRGEEIVVNIDTKERADSIAARNGSSCRVVEYEDRERIRVRRVDGTEEVNAETE